MKTIPLLKIDYVGSINDKMAGFYRSSYECDGVTKYLGVTQFEPTDARKAFPCWDELVVKGNFHLWKPSYESYFGLSNMDEDFELFQMMEENDCKIQGITDNVDISCSLGCR